MDLKKMGFNSEKEYKGFLDKKLNDLNKKVAQHIDVFKRLKNK